jgi:putative RNA 2'-phosphotransferase
MDYVALSKTISHALRHEPQRYGLVLEPAGWVKISHLIEGIKSVCPEFVGLEVGHIEKAVLGSAKRRHELSDGEIRALYGHSTMMSHNLIPVVPPETLYHGTPARNQPEIEHSGLKKMDRQFVHLSTTSEEADIVARRRSAEVLIFAIQTRQAHLGGITFYRSGDVWLCDHMPAKYLRLCSTIEP